MEKEPSKDVPSQLTKGDQSVFSKEQALSSSSGFPRKGPVKIKVAGFNKKLLLANQKETPDAPMKRRLGSLASGPSP